MKLLRYTINFGEGYIGFYIFLTKEYANNIDCRCR